jgi:hypothetical protein
MINLKQCFQTGLLLAATTLSLRAGSFFSDFNSGTLPAGTHTNNNLGSGGSGGAYLELVDGVGNSGCFKITKSVNSQNGSLIIDDLDSGNPIYGFDVTFQVRIGGGTSTPADGFALVVDPTLTDTSIWGEGGTGTGLSFTWGIYTGSGQNPPDPGIRVRVNGGIVAYHGYTISGMETGGTDPSNWWQPVHIRLNPDGSLVWDFKGVNVFTNFFVPGYQALANSGVPVRFGISGRTGGLNENFWIDNLSITTFTTPMVGISQQPFSQLMQQGNNATFDVRVANTNGVSYQWYSNNVSLGGATGQTLVVSNVQPSFSGSSYKVIATGPNNAVTSAVVSLTVTNIGIPGSPQLSFNFDDGMVPAGTTVNGNAYVSPTGGVNNSGVLHLTDNFNGQSGAFVVADPNTGANVYGFTAHFKSLEGGGSSPPADGFGFAFGNDIPATPAGMFEQGQGLGTGLVVGFDIFDNTGIFGFLGGEGPDPSINVHFGGQLIAQTQMEPLSFMETGKNADGSPAFDDTVIQLNTDGRLTVVYRGALVFNRLPIPGFGSIAGASYSLGARTGGLNENQWVDNFDLTTVTTPGAVRIVSQTSNQLILVNHAVTNSITVNDTNSVTYQWYRGTTAIPSATSSSYSISSVALIDSGALFTGTATKSSITVTSAPMTLTVVDLTAPTSPQYSYNFDDGLVPTATANIYGNASVTANGGVGDSGVLHLTDALNGQNSAFVVSNFVFNGAQVSAIAASFDVREGGGSGTPADGFSFNWAAGLTDGVVGNAETGTGNGFSLCFRIYIGNGNADNPPSPYIAIKYKGAFIASTQIPAVQLSTDNGITPGFRTMLLRVDSNGKVYLAYGERVLYNGLQLPNFTFIANSKFGFYGRTGGLNENQWFDNIKIQATQSSGPLTIATQPANATVIAGKTATFTVSLSDPNGASYQWSKNGSTIGGATQSSYTTPATTLSDNGALFKVSATGPSGSATSSNALLTVVSAITVTNPTVSYNFDDCAQPAGTDLRGSSASSGYIGTGGVGGSCCLHLTDAVNGQGGTFIIPDQNNNAPIKGFNMYFAANISGGTVPPADGISISFCSSNEVPATGTIGEGGVGTGLIVIFDLFNGNNPYFGITWHGSPIVQTFVPYTAMDTGGNFVDTGIRLNANGTIDVQFNGNVLFNQVPLPGFAAVAGREFVFGSRTGGLNDNQWIDNLQIQTFPGLVSVPLNASINGGNLRLTWNGDGFKLQSASNLVPRPIVWTDVPGATSPYVTPLTGAAQFYRLAPAP